MHGIPFFQWKASTQKNKVCKESSKNYVDEMRWVGGWGIVNEISTKGC